MSSADPNTKDPNLKTAVDEFMLKEYESIAAAHFDSQTAQRQQFRFYLGIVALPVTIIGLSLSRQNSLPISLLSLQQPFNSVFFIIGVLGCSMYLSMIHTTMDAILYARTVNGIRAYFVERGKSAGNDFNAHLKLPTDKEAPRYFQMRTFFWQAIMIGLINTFYLVAGSNGTLGFGALCVAMACLLGAVAHLLFYLLFCIAREKREIVGNKAR